MTQTLHKHADGLLIAGLSVLAFAAFVFIQFATAALVGTDGYYHLKLALLLKELPLSAWPGEFPWLPLTVLAPDRYVDHHFLFHVFIIPFTGISELVGGKVAASFFAAAAFVVFQLALPRLKWTTRVVVSVLFFAASPAFLYRMSMLRAQSLSLAMLLLMFILLINRRKYALAASAFIYVWMYNAFPMVLLLLGCYAVAQKLTKGTLPIELVAWTLGGLVLGMLVNPYFPENLIFLYHHLIDKFRPAGYAVKVGSEWYPYEAQHFVMHAALSVVLLGAAFFYAPERKKGEAQTVWTLLLFCVVLLAMLLKSRRFIELFPPFALLAAAWAVHVSEQAAAVKLPRLILPFTALLLLLGNSIQTARESIAESQPADRYKDTAVWLSKNTPEGSLVFMSDWDDFTRLFYWNENNSYLAGLDPYFLYTTDNARFHLWRRMTQGKLKAPPGPLIAGRFGARYVFIDKDHDKFRKQLEKDKTARRVFKSGDSYVYEITTNRPNDEQA